MPRLEPKQIQKELETGRVWPVYWVYGSERMKVREIVKRIRKAALPEGPAFGEEILDGAETSGRQVVDAAQSLALGGGIRFLVVRDAHLLKEPDVITELLGVGQSSQAKPLPRKLEELESVCVFLSKDLDGRKKLSKALLEAAAVVPCEEIAESERDAWIAYLAKRRGMSLSGERVLRMRGVDPWSLDIVDQELEKLSLSADSGETMLEAPGQGEDGDAFLAHFFSRDEAPALKALTGFADHPDESLPLLGLLGWNARYLALSLSGSPQRVNPYLAERLARWSKLWTLEEALMLQEALSNLDYQLKQTPRLSLGTWAELVIRFCRQTTAC